MTVGKKIAATLGALAVLTVGLGSVAAWSISRIQGSLQSIADNSLPAVMVMGRIDSLQLDLRGATLHHVATPDPKMKAVKDAQAAVLKQQAEQLLADYAKTIFTSRDRELFAPVPEALHQYIDVCERIRALSLQGNTTGAMALYDTEGDSTRKRLREAIADLLALNREEAQADAASATSAAALGRRLNWSILSLSILMGFALATWIVRGVNRSLRESISDLAQGAEQLRRASSALSASSQTLAEGASEQAASLEETSASANEVSAMAKQNASNSTAAAAMMGEVGQKVEEANRTLEQMVHSMGEITGSSEKISKIIKVIDEIAFQTNLLALNAAVEAARAGEAGMGFAVVADEVRTLAQRSAQAAKDTATLIEESISKSAAGKSTLDQVARAIRGMTESSVKVKDLVDQVSGATQEQTRGMEEISRSLLQLDAVTQRTAATSEEGASASEELAGEAESTVGVIARLQALVESPRV